MDEKKSKHAGGRPPKVKTENLAALGKTMVEWFSLFADDLETRKKVPFFSKFGREVVGVTDDTLKKYCEKDDSFRTAYEHCKQIQKEILIEGGLNGIFNPTAFIFTAKNLTDMRNRDEVEHHGLPTPIFANVLINNKDKKDVFIHNGDAKGIEAHGADPGGAGGNVGK